MINLDLRKESPQNNVNRILALESLIKYYPLSVIEEVDSRVVQEWIEEIDGQDKTFKQIDLAFVIFGLPTPELKHLMEKVEKRMRAILEEQKAKLSLEQIEAINNGGHIDLTPEEESTTETPSSIIPEVKPLTREERQEQNRIYRQQMAIEAEQRLKDHYAGIVIEEDKEELSQEDYKQKASDDYDKELKAIAKKESKPFVPKQTDL